MRLKERRAAAYSTSTGTERLFGPSERLAERLRAALANAGFRASIAVSANYDAACMKAAATRGITVIPEGDEGECAREAAYCRAESNEEHEETFALWGIRTLGELAALPEAELVTRLGPQARTMAGTRAWHGEAYLSAHRAGIFVAGILRV